MIWKVLGEITHQRTEARPRQRHREGGHRHWAKVKDFRIDVERRQSLNPTKESFISINTAAVLKPTISPRMLLTYPRGDDNGLEPLKNWFDGDRWVHTAERSREDSNVKTDYCKVKKLPQKLYLTLAAFFDTGLLLKSKESIINRPHLKCSTGLAIVGVLSSKGSMMIVKPSCKESKNA